MSVWHLRVGAQVHILGKPCTLQKCNQATANWNKFWCDRLSALKRQAETEVAKYNNTIRLPRWIQKDQRRSSGDAPLACMMAQLLALCEILRSYRPRLAEEFSIPGQMREISALAEQSSNGAQIGNATDSC